MAAVKNYGKRLRRPRKKDLLRLVEQLRKDYEDLNEIIDEKDQEISELRELLTELENVRWDAERHVTCLRAEIDVSRMMFRNYRQDHGLLPPTVPEEDDDWDGK